MLDDENRRLIMDRLGRAVDELVADLYSDTAGGISVVQEAEITSRILDCYAGSRAWGISSTGDRRKMVAERLREAKASNLLDIILKKDRG